MCNKHYHLLVVSDTNKQIFVRFMPANILDRSNRKLGRHYMRRNPADTSHTVTRAQIQNVVSTHITTEDIQLTHHNRNDIQHTHHNRTDGLETDLHNGGVVCKLIQRLQTFIRIGVAVNIPQTHNPVVRAAEQHACSVGIPVNAVPVSK